MAGYVPDLNGLPKYWYHVTLINPMIDHHRLKLHVGGIRVGSHHFWGLKENLVVLMSINGDPHLLNTSGVTDVIIVPMSQEKSFESTPIFRQYRVYIVPDEMRGVDEHRLFRI